MRWLCLVLCACGRVEFGAPLDAAAVPVDSAPPPDTDNCAELPGLIAHWTLDDADIQGTTVIDRSGANRHGTIMGASAAKISGRIGGAVEFPALNTWIQMPDLPFDQTLGAFNTVSIWFFNADPMPNDALAYFPPHTSPAPPRYDLWFRYGGTGVASLCINTGIGECWGVSDPGLVGRWVHVVAVLVNGREDGGAMYIDGVDINASCRFGTCTQVRTIMNPMTLAGPDTGFPWEGAIDDVRVFDRALTAAEIAQLHACAQ